MLSIKAAGGIRTAEDVAAELGEMKGVLMKAGQLISFIFEALPDEAQEALLRTAYPSSEDLQEIFDRIRGQEPEER